MICPNCETILPDDSVFCPECGSRVDAATSANTYGDESAPLSGSARNASHEDAEKNTKIGMVVVLVVALLVVIGIIAAIFILPGCINSLTNGGQ
ncbi:MAG: zinc ribbon domain-containing protein [Coriobacteriales bacterium]|nr:zinc ribbon domain-containing protein [Coriobacteriales bacterium]